MIKDKGTYYVDSQKNVFDKSFLMQNFGGDDRKYAVEAFWTLKKCTRCVNSLNCKLSSMCTYSKNLVWCEECNWCNDLYRGKGYNYNKIVS